MLCPALGLLVFVVSLCRAGCRAVGCRIVGLLWKWDSAGIGGALDQQGTKAPTRAPQPTRYIRGELNTSMVLDALREKKCQGKG